MARSQAGSESTLWDKVLSGQTDKLHHKLLDAIPPHCPYFSRIADPGSSGFRKCTTVLRDALGFAEAPSLETFLLGQDQPESDVQKATLHVWLELCRMVNEDSKTALVEGRGMFGCEDGSAPADHYYCEVRRTPAGDLAQARLGALDARKQRGAIEDEDCSVRLLIVPPGHGHNPGPEPSLEEFVYSGFRIGLGGLDKSSEASHVKRALRNGIVIESDDHEPIAMASVRRAHVAFDFVETWSHFKLLVLALEEVLNPTLWSLTPWQPTIVGQPFYVIDPDVDDYSRWLDGRQTEGPLLLWAIWDRVVAEGKEHVVVPAGATDGEVQLS